jgi:hypothetical protein
MAVDWVFVIYLCFIILVFPLILVLSLWRYHTIKRLMENQALKRSGTVTGSFLTPHLNFSYRGIPVIVTSLPGTKYRHARTDATITLTKSAPAAVTITPTPLLGGKDDIQVGFDEFDQAFLIRSEDDAFIRTLMTTGLQTKLVEMKHDKPMVFIHGTSVMVSIPKILKTDEGYDQLFDLTFAVIDRLTEL